MPWRRKWLPIAIFLPEEFHGQRSQAGYSPWDRRESEMTVRLFPKCVGCKKPSRLCFCGILRSLRCSGCCLKVRWDNTMWLPSKNGTAKSRKDKSELWPTSLLGSFPSRWFIGEAVLHLDTNLQDREVSLAAGLGPFLKIGEESNHCPRREITSCTYLSLGLVANLGQMKENRKPVF